MRMRHRHTGFTLVELVVVIVVLGAISAGTAVYIVRSMEAYSDTVRRDQLTSTARIAVEKMTRELRNALPNSVRIRCTTPSCTSSDTHCIEFFPVQSGSSYESVPRTAANVSFAAVDYIAPQTPATAYVAVYPYSTSSLYDKNNPGPLADYDDSNSDPANGEVYLTSSHRFTHDSPHKRFFLTGPPISYCLGTGGDLRRYQNYSINSAQPVPPAGSGALLAENLQLSDGGTAVTPFRYDPGSLQRNGVVTLDLRVRQDNEWVRLLHEVQIRNVP
ncbi:prepilin-type N-terminal cleavage/methylation domain-containing protein [Thiohalophilus sp.]|uniref:prepilin-type N-terminal cleavage/methylation domain-containing protein n=1 Tax=Thiohalophilus sp. TaxID=3028392 RepID=UPI002ACDF44E|nr:prepilin-type N-terminal cleavage/methylation domain-containing protein [Thiohalophilus sp.]MDZ7803399.1 prepilin-type N-terminal cleavage/methylation domain-containing protein [Thiohalophilus sp.]